MKDFPYSLVILDDENGFAARLFFNGDSGLVVQHGNSPAQITNTNSSTSRAEFSRSVTNLETSTGKEEGKKLLRKVYA
jgi:hypothetical protein